MTDIRRRPDEVPVPYPMPRVGTRDALAAFRAGEPVIVEKGHLPDGRPALRVRLPEPASTPQRRARRRVHPAVWVGAAAGVLGLLAAFGWALSIVLGMILGHAMEIGGSLALAVLVLGAVGGGTCVTIVTVRHHH